MIVVWDARFHVSKSLRCRVQGQLPGCEIEVSPRRAGKRNRRNLDRGVK